METIAVSVMLRIKVIDKGAPAKKLDISSAYLLGNDRVPLRAALKFVKGEIVSDARSRGAAALSITLIRSMTATATYDGELEG